MASKRTILIIEDNEDVRALLEFVLGEAGFSVRMAADGREGLAALESGPAPDLVLLDIMLPIRDGFELLGDIRGRPRCAQLPVVMITARNHEDDIAAAFAAGATDYIEKPFQPMDVVDRIKKLLPP